MQLLPNPTNEANELIITSSLLAATSHTLHSFMLRKNLALIQNKHKILTKKLEK